MNFHMMRWLEKHHNRRVVNHCALSEKKFKQLQQMFNHIDEDLNGTIELEEIELAIAYVLLLLPLVLLRAPLLLLPLPLVLLRASLLLLLLLLLSDVGRKRCPSRQLTLLLY